MTGSQLQTQIIQLIQKSEKILILPSSPPDGDSIGSALALFHVIKKLGKQATVACADPVPEAIQFLPTTNIIDSKLVTSNDFIVTLDLTKAKLDTIKTDLQDNKVNIIITPKEGTLGDKDVSFHYGQSKYDLIIVVDTGDLSQLGKLYEQNAGLFTQVPVINIDHHISNNHFGKINYIDIMASSTTELLIPVLEELSKVTGKELITEDVATLLLAGIITDTGSFQNANTSPKAFANASHLLGYGARQQEIIQHIYKTKNLTMLKLWGRVLTKIQFDKLFRIVWSTISQQDFKETQSRDEDTGDIIDELMTNAPGADIVLLIKQRHDGIISGSIRTVSPSIDASVIAEMFDGGGHTQAAGFKIKNGDLLQTEQNIIKKIREFQAKRLNIHPDEQPEVVDLKLNKEKFTKKLEAKKNWSAAKPAAGKKAAPKDIVESVAKNQDEIDLQPGVTYKFEV
ncbi:bifunctional oligoribonuclease/PAP phosphatase NrnA [Candidatus Peregrinibacteria bacterium]|nr:bifunctional oligoribonuclease/PAP phosphatase NrnA [Candidatus Peregrinibacteria bacterium]